MHYMAFLWDRSVLGRSEVARMLMRQFLANAWDWKVILERDGLCVCCRARSGPDVDKPYVLDNEQGVVIGRIFETNYALRPDTIDCPPAEVALDPRRSARIVASAGRELVDNFWGRYVAFLHEPDSGRNWVMRDPSGDVPCQWSRVLGVDVYFVRLEDLEKLRPQALTINWHYVVGSLLFPNMRIRETGVKEIESVLPGECIKHDSHHRSHEFYWNPLDIAASDPIESDAQAVRLTRDTVRACVHAWASCFDRVLLSLSGGLDSSIVLACLHNAPTTPRLVCRNRYSTGADLDERTFARIAAERAGVPLMEDDIGGEFNLDSMAQMPRSIFPVPHPVDLTAVAPEVRFLRSLEVSAEFTGNGGDELFFRGGSFPTAVDYAWNHGPRPSLISVALDDAVLNRTSLWAILRRVYDYGVRKHPWHVRDAIGAAHMPLMDAEIKRQAQSDMSLWHPLYRDIPNLPPGKYQHAYVLTSCAGGAHYPMRGDDMPDQISPLLSQPLMELSLRTPLYVLRKGGRDRAIARRAFANDVPTQIISRQSKAFADGHFHEVLSRHIHWVREIMLDGFLVREKILDRSKLEVLLSGRLSKGESSLVELCDYLPVEVWLRSWHDISRRAAA